MLLNASKVASSTTLYRLIQDQGRIFQYMEKQQCSFKVLELDKNMRALNAFPDSANQKCTLS